MKGRDADVTKKKVSVVVFALIGSLLTASDAKVSGNQTKDEDGLFRQQTPSIQTPSAAAAAAAATEKEAAAPVSARGRRGQNLGFEEHGQRPAGQKSSQPEWHQVTPPGPQKATRLLKAAVLLTRRRRRRILPRYDPNAPGFTVPAGAGEATTAEEGGSKTGIIVAAGVGGGVAVIALIIIIVVVVVKKKQKKAAQAAQQKPDEKAKLVTKPEDSAKKTATATTVTTAQTTATTATSAHPKKPSHTTLKSDNPSGPAPPK